MASIDFPTGSPQNSPFTAPNGITYVWNTDGYWEVASAANLPIATEDSLGGIIVGNNLSVEVDGTLSATSTSGSVGTLQEVTDAGASTDNTINVNNKIELNSDGTISGQNLSDGNLTKTVTEILQGSGSGGVSRLIAGGGVTLDPASGQGDVTITASGGDDSGIVQTFQKFAIIADVRSTDSAGGGTTTAGGTVTRVLNTIVADEGGLIGNLNNNYFTLHAGQYHLEWSCPAYAVTEHQSYLQNITDNERVAVGTTSYSQPASTDANSNSTDGSAYINITKDTQFCIQHWTLGAMGDYGLGVPNQSHSTENIYTVVRITDLTLTGGTGTSTNTNIYGTAKVFAHVNWSEMPTSGTTGMSGVYGSRGIQHIERIGTASVRITFTPGLFTTDGYSCSIMPKYDGASGGWIAYESNHFERTKDQVQFTFATATASVAPVAFDVIITDIAPAEVSLTTTGDVINYGGAAAWATFDSNYELYADDEIQIGNSLNIKRIVYVSTGVYNVEFIDSMPDGNYSVVANGSVSYANRTADGFTLNGYSMSTGAAANSQISFAIHALNALPPKGTTGNDAWASINADATINASYNIASVTNAGDGLYDVVFTTPMPTANYSVVGSANSAAVPYRTFTFTNVTTTGFRAQCATFNYANGATILQNSDLAFTVNATNANLPATITQEQLEDLLKGIEGGYSGVTAYGWFTTTGELQPGSMNIASTEYGAFPSAYSGNTYRVTFDTPMPNDDYVVQVSSQLESAATPSVTNKTTTTFDVVVARDSGGGAAMQGNIGFVVVSQNAAPPRGTTGADAWGHIIGATHAMGSSYNATSVYNGNGNYSITFDTPMPSENYALVASTTMETETNAYTYILSQTKTGFDVLVSTGAAATNDSWSFTVHATNANLPTTITQEQVEALARNPMVGAWASVTPSATVNTAATIHKAFNIRSITTNATQSAKVDVVFETPMNDANYSVVGSAFQNTGESSINWTVLDNKTAEGFSFGLVNVATSGAPGTPCYFQVIGATRNAAPLGGGADAWAVVDTDGSLLGGFNCTSSRTSPGFYRIDFDPVLPNENYSIQLSCPAGAGSGKKGPYWSNKSASGFDIYGYNESGTLTDTVVDVAVFATDGNAGGHWAEDDGVLIPAKADTLQVDWLTDNTTTKSMNQVLVDTAAFSWGSINADGTASGGYNIASVTKTAGSTGNGNIYNIVFTEEAPINTYAVVTGIELASESDVATQFGRTAMAFNKTTTGFTVGILSTASANLIDMKFNFVVYVLTP